MNRGADEGNIQGEVQDCLYYEQHEHAAMMPGIGQKDCIRGCQKGVAEAVTGYISGRDAETGYEEWNIRSFDPRDRIRGVID